MRAGRRASFHHSRGDGAVRLERDRRRRDRAGAGRDGGLLPYVKMQSNVRFIRSEILKWMEERQYKPKSPSRK
jgi:hypothetical protein